MHVNQYSVKLNPFKYVWIVLKLIYLYLGYCLVGLDDQYFYIAKGNYFSALFWFRRAIPNYQEALRESQDPLIHLALGFCLLRVGRFGEAIEHYRIANEKVKLPDVALGLAIVEYETGNIGRCREIIQELEASDQQLFLTNNKVLKKIKEKIQKD